MLNFLFFRVNYKLLFDTDVELGLSKADRVKFGDSRLTHVMIFTGCSLSKDGTATKFRVENSWGEEDCGEKGYLVMTAQWFREFGYEIVVDKKHVNEKIMKVFDTEPILLPCWDPLGNIKL